MAGNAAGGMPGPVQRALADLGPDCRAKLVDLYGKVRFNEDHLESFQINSGTLTGETVGAFRAFVEGELAQAAVKPPAAEQGAAARAAQQRVPFMKRARSAVLGAVGTALGRPAKAGADEAAAAVAPDPKRPREARDDECPEPATVTPARPRRTLQVTTKSSMNDGGLPTTADGGDAAAAASVELLGDPALWTGPRRGAYAWMDEALDERAAARDARLAEMEPELVAAVRARHPDGEELAAGGIGVATQAEVILCGRVVCEGFEGRLNERAMLLEGTHGASKSARVQLNVASCPALAAFPGQIVAVLGRCGMGGSTFHARDFLPGLTLPPAPALAAPARSRQLHVQIMAGPFCLRDGLDYSPLEEGLEHAVSHAPHVLLLLGPFVDASNRGVASGEPVLPGRPEDEVCSLPEVYTRHVLPLLRRGVARLKAASPSTEVLVVPSLDEALGFHPMPQPPLDAAVGPSLDAAGAEHLRRLGARFLPNPAHLSVDGLRLTVTSADALTPVLRAGLVLRPEERRIERALRLLLEQRSLFPVLPREPTGVSEARASALDFPEQQVPDVVVFPSATGGAAGQAVDGRLFVNPGSVCRPAALGSFAELWLAPPPLGGGSGPLLPRARVDIKTFSA